MIMRHSLGLALLLSSAGHQMAPAKAAAEPLTEAGLCAAVRAAAEGMAASRGAGWRAEVHCRPMSSRPNSGLATIQAERKEAERLVSGKQTWSVHVRPERGAAYVLALPVTIGWTAPTWALLRELKAGERLQAADLHLQEQTWPPGVAVEAARTDEPPQGRARRTLHAGEAVRAADLIALDTLQRGDRVTVVMASEGIELAMPAQLLAPARVGQSVRVQADGRSAPMEGLLVDLTTVRVNKP